VVRWNESVALSASDRPRRGAEIAPATADGAPSGRWPPSRRHAAPGRAEQNCAAEALRSILLAPTGAEEVSSPSNTPEYRPEGPGPLRPVANRGESSAANIAPCLRRPSLRIAALSAVRSCCRLRNPPRTHPKTATKGGPGDHRDRRTAGATAAKGGRQQVAPSRQRAAPSEVSQRSARRMPCRPLRRPATSRRARRRTRRSGPKWRVRAGGDQSCPRATSAEAFEQGATYVGVAAAPAGSSRSTPLALALAPGTWSERPGRRHRDDARCLRRRALESPSRPGPIVPRGDPGFGPSAPVERVDSGPYAGWFVYYGTQRPRSSPSHARGSPASRSPRSAAARSASPRAHLEIGLTPPDAAACCPATARRRRSSRVSCASFYAGSV